MYLYQKIYHFKVAFWVDYFFCLLDHACTLVIFQNNVSAILNIVNNLLGSFYCERTQMKFLPNMYISSYFHWAYFIHYFLPPKK
jgi:hypothetical protein